MDRKLRPRTKRIHYADEQSGPSKRREAAQINGQDPRPDGHENEVTIKIEYRTTVVHTSYYCRNLIEDVVIKVLKKFDITTNFTDSLGLTHFHVACMVGHIKMVETMLKGGVMRTLPPVTALDPLMKCKKNSPLHFAVEHLQVEVVKLLLKYNADVNARNEKGRTPLHIACSIKPKYCKVLIERYRRCSKAKEYLDTQPEIQIIKLLLKHGARMDERDMRENTPLLRAFAFNYLDLIDYFAIMDSLQAKIHYSNVLDKIQITAKRNQLRKMKLLVDSGADPSVKNVHGNNILHLIIVNLHHQRQPQILSQLSFKDVANAEAVNSMLATGRIDVNEENNKGDTPLTLAVAYLSFQVVKVLFRYKADVDTIKIFFYREQSLYFRYANTLANYDAVDNLLNIVEAIQKNKRYINLAENIIILLFLEGVRGKDTCIRNMHNRKQKAEDFILRATGKKLEKALEGRRSAQFMRFLISFRRAIHVGNLYFEPELLPWLMDATAVDEAEALANQQKRFECDFEMRSFRREQEEMSITMIDGISLLTLLQSELWEIYKFIYVARKRRLLKMFRYNLDFPFHIDIINAHFTKALIRYYYVEAARDYFRTLTKKTLPWMCTDRIFDYLEQEDLKNLCLSCVRINVNYSEDFK